MRLLSCFCGSCSISMSICSTIYSTYWVSSWTCTYSPSSSYVGCSDSSTFIGAFFFVSAPCLSSYSYFFFSSLSLLLSSCSTFSFFFVSCNFLYLSSNLCLSLFLHSTLHSHYHLFASISKYTFSTRVSSLNTSTIFLLPLYYVNLLLTAAMLLSPCCAAFHCTAMLTSSLSLDDL